MRTPSNCNLRFFTSLSLVPNQWATWATRKNNWLTINVTSIIAASNNRHSNKRAVTTEERRGGRYPSVCVCMAYSLLPAIAHRHLTDEVIGNGMG